MKEYDEKLREIEMFRLHPTLIPFVGNEYEKYRVLHIGESHYIDQTPDNTKYDIEYFKRWWTDPCNEVLEDSFGWADTRQVMSNYMEGRHGAYTIFTNFIKSFSKVVLDREIPSISDEDKKLYRYIAFMNFFQMPSIYEGTKFWDSLEISANMIGKPELANEMWNTAVKNSVKAVDQVIEIINPTAIVFTSISAGNAYKDYDGKYSKDQRIIYTSHPAYPFTWWKTLKSLDGKRGIDVFEEGLKKIYKS